MGLDNVNDRPRAFVMFDRSARRASGRTCGGAGGVVYFRRAVKSEVRVFVCASSRVSVVAFAVLGAYLFVVYSTVLRGEPVRISSMVLFVAYAFYYRNVFSIVIYHHMPRERRCLRHPGPQQ